jgi:hypothetical protein
VFRFDDGLHRAWDGHRPDALASRLGPLLRARVDDAELGGVCVQEVQLDYDAPVRRLGEWAELVTALADGSLRGRELWITSIPAHLRDPGYGARFAGHVRGHILQLFDTGLRHDATVALEISRRLARQELAFRVGFGAFERRSASGRRTDHAAWLGSLPLFAKLDGFSGVWVFPAGRDPQSELAFAAEVMK